MQFFLQASTVTQGSFLICCDQAAEAEARINACNILQRRLRERLAQQDVSSSVSQAQTEQGIEFRLESQSLSRHQVLDVLLEDLDFLDLLQWARKISVG